MQSKALTWVNPPQTPEMDLKEKEEQRKVTSQVPFPKSKSENTGHFYHRMRLWTMHFSRIFKDLRLQLYSTKTSEQFPAVTFNVGKATFWSLYLFALRAIILSINNSKITCLHDVSASHLTVIFSILPYLFYSFLVEQFGCLFREGLSCTAH